MLFLTVRSVNAVGEEKTKLVLLSWTSPVLGQMLLSKTLRYLSCVISSSPVCASISLFYVGISSVEESIIRIANRVRKGGHNISTEDVLRRYKGRFEAFGHVLPYCDEITFYDNENGFVKVAELKNSRFCYTNGYRPKWLLELVKCAGLQTEE